MIVIQPFAGMPNAEVQYVFGRLSQIYPAVRLAPPIDLPRAAWYPARNRYRADSIIQYLARREKPGVITLGLTGSDVSVTKDSIADWGVMGLGFVPGSASVASDFRLAPKDRRVQLFKIALHELGHNEGLGHCLFPTCYMRDAEGHNFTDEETGFCPKCRSYLERKGWIFRPVKL
jgi:archaemetzincin